VSAALKRVPMTRAQFLAWDETQPDRWEYDGFGPVAMTGGTVAHQVIQGNLFALLWNALRGRTCQVYGSELKVASAGSIRYPDAFVSCTPMALTDTVASEPVVVFEILSRSSALTDLTVKSTEYRDTPSIRRYIAVEQYRVGATVFSREAGRWTATLLGGAEAILALPEIGVELRLGDLYERVTLGPPPVPLSEE
jgi:Uma2 family endonuclease